MKQEKIWWAFFIIFTLSLVASVYLVYLSSEMNEYSEENVYSFSFNLMKKDFDSDSNNKIQIHNFCFYYDFTDNKANLSFDVPYANWSLSSINIVFPSTIQSETLDVYSIKNETRVDIEADNIEVNDQKNLQINGFNREFYNEKIVVEFKSDLQPQGGFRFYSNMYNVILPNIEQANVFFVLGDNYECTGDCVYDLKYVEKTQYCSDRNIMLNFVNTATYEDKWFKLNTANKDTRWNKTLLFGIGISGLVASLNSIAILLYDEFYTNSMKSIYYAYLKTLHFLNISSAYVKKIVNVIFDND